MTTNLAESLIYLETSKELWDEVKERYGQTNAPLLYQLKKELSDLKQENQAVGNFYCKLKNLWDHISSIEGIPECTCGAMSKCTCNMMKKLADAESLNKLIQFLMALNEGFENIRGSILAMEPLPPVNRAFHLVQQQEKQKEITGNMTTNTEVSAMNVKRQPTNNWQRRESKEAKMKKKCDHCLMKGHTKEECFELLGYPDWFKNPPKVKSKKVAANVNKPNAEPASETPLDKNFEHGEFSGTKLDPSLISTVVHEVMKAMSEKQHLANLQVFLPDINSEDQERNDEGGGDNSLIEESLETLEFFDASEFVHMDSETSEQIFHNDESAAVEQEVATQSMPIQEENAEPKETRRSERERTVSKKLKDYIYKIPGMTGQSDESTAFTVHTLGYIQSKKDYSLFTKEENGKQAIILAYVDDLLITCDNLEEIERVKKNLDKEFTIKDLGELRFFVGIEIDRNENGIILN
uniref:Reverse transcriptase Ty1/copia-type domain-containing protein n=1 Tax=Chenopodium quinoa TaxID=63459 RepID=A0A803MDX4_CHEQI